MKKEWKEPSWWWILDNWQGKIPISLRWTGSGTHWNKVSLFFWVKLFVYGRLFSVEQSKHEWNVEVYQGFLGNFILCDMINVVYHDKSLIFQGYIVVESMLNEIDGLIRAWFVHSQLTCSAWLRSVSKRTRCRRTQLSYRFSYKIKIHEHR